MSPRRTRPNTGRVTINDVAAHCGMSIKTVSRVLNDEPNVRRSTRARVEASVQALDYSPNPSARGLAGTHSRMLGFIYNNPSPNYLLRAITGALEACNAAGYGLSLQTCSTDETGLADSILRFVSRSRVDGLLLVPPVGDIPAVLDAIDATRLPCARMAPLDGRPGLGVAIDDRHAAARVVEHLTDLGHTRIGLISGHPDHGATRARLEGYRLGLLRANIDFRPELVFGGRFDAESGRRAGDYFLAMQDPPTAIFASNDEMAAGLLQAALDRQWRVPGQLSIAGFDDTPISSMIWPPLTTVHQPIRAMALRATEFLLDAIAGGKDSDGPAASRIEVFDAPLIVRETTATPGR